MTTTKTIQLFHNDDVLEVEFTFKLMLQNDGIGGYEYCGMRGFDVGRDYYEVEDWQWDESLYTEEQNMSISHYTTTPEFGKIEEEVCDAALKVDY